MSKLLIPDPTAAALLDSSAMALAARVAEQLVGGPDAGDKADEFPWWQSYMASRLRDLAAAVNLGRPRLFISQLHWCHDSMAAKKLPTEPLRTAVTALADVLDHTLEQHGQAIAQDYVRPAIDDLAGYNPPASPKLDTTTDEGRLTALYILAVLEGDRRKALSLIHDTVDGGMSIQDACEHILIPAANQIGLMWHQDEVTVGEEHFATATTQVAIAQLMGRHNGTPPHGKTVLAAGTTGDRHGLGLQVVADFFEMDGFKSICLGPDVPIGDFVQGLAYFQPDLIVISAAMHTHLKTLAQTIRAVREASTDRPVSILVGGHAFKDTPEIAEQLGADAYADTARDAVITGRKLVGLD